VRFFCTKIYRRVLRPVRRVEKTPIARAFFLCAVDGILRLQRQYTLMVSQTKQHQGLRVPHWGTQRPIFLSGTPF